MNNRSLGILPPVYDSRDLRYAVRSATVEDVKDIPGQWDGMRDTVVCIGTQGNVGTCGGWAGAGLLKYLIKMNDPSRFHVFPSAGAVYDLSRSLLDTVPAEGTYARAVMKAMQTIGIPPEWCAPTDKKAPFEIEYCPDWQTEAELYRIRTYRSVPTDVDSIKAAVWGLTVAQPFKGYTPLFITVPVYESFFSAYGDGVVPMPNEGEKFRGGHALLLRGWVEKRGMMHWVVVNSWGVHMGDQGVYYIPFEYKMWEAWLATDDDPLVEPEEDEEEEEEDEEDEEEDDRPGCLSRIFSIIR